MNIKNNIENKKLCLFPPAVLLENFCIFTYMDVEMSLEIVIFQLSAVLFWNSDKKLELCE